MYWEEHITTLRELFEGIRSAGLTIKPQKCGLGTTYVTFLGHRLGEGKIQPVERVVLPRLQRWKLKSSTVVLGIARYYRDLIAHYANEAQPLIEKHERTSKKSSSLPNGCER
ncbi:hypothetical protein HPB48_021520 [Haemaphysalis longicornis]|uniref:Reverse transcriptase domain-containing protein n=1 Tax=Haemaphysalis longicornis TaxID=44386 RepID=A0A9J6GE99_HAELO|nr:hypothetical protein HPB48_021520 [Haemaphysalis longicornis]